MICPVARECAANETQLDELRAELDRTRASAEVVAAGYVRTIAEVTRLREALASASSGFEWALKHSGKLPDLEDGTPAWYLLDNHITAIHVALQGSQPAAPTNDQFNCPPVCDRCGRCHLGECEVTAIIEIDPRDGNMTIKPVEPTETAVPCEKSELGERLNESSCRMCSGDICATHGTDPCQCDVLKRHLKPAVQWRKRKHEGIRS